MAVPQKVTVQSIVLGESVSPAIANRPHDNLETNIDNILAFIQGGVTSYFDQDLATTTGLTFGYEAGLVRKDETLVSIAASTIALTASQTNYIQLSVAGAVEANTTGFTNGAIPLWEAVTDVGTITGVTDKRTWIVSTEATNLALNNVNITADSVDGAFTELSDRIDAVAGDSIAFAIVFGS